MDFQRCKNTLLLLQEENYRSTYFICVHWWEVLFPKIQKNSKEIDLVMTSEAFPAAHISNAPCMALPLGDFSVECCLFLFLVFPLFLFLTFLSLLFALCLLKQHLVNPWANSHHLLILTVIVVYILAKDPFVFYNVTLLLAQRAMISDKLP